MLYTIFLICLSYGFDNSWAKPQNVATTGQTSSIATELKNYLHSPQFEVLPAHKKSELLGEIYNITDSISHGILGQNSTKATSTTTPKTAVPILKADLPTHRSRNLSYGVGVDGDDSTTADDTKYPENCLEIMNKGEVSSGIYTIKPNISPKPFQVLCDMTTQGGGWTHIQKRVDGRTNFNRGWSDYKFGFGYLDEGHEFWMGLENIYSLTAGQMAMELLVEITDREGLKAYALYNSFAVGPEQDSYPLKILTGYSGDAGESMSSHLGMKFSTFDFDNDNYTENCAEIFHSGWWYKNCFTANPNGQFTNVDLPQAYIHRGIHWRDYRTLEYCHKDIRMLVRPL